MLTTHPLLLLRLRKSWAIPPLTLWVLLGLLRGSLYHKQRSLLRVSVAYFGHLQGGVLWRMFHIERRNNLQIQNIILYSCVLLVLFLIILTLILTCRPYSSVVCREFYLIFLCNIFSLGVLNSAIYHNVFSHSKLLFHVSIHYVIHYFQYSKFYVIVMFCTFSLGPI
jgi:hypothetical protein